MARPLPEAPDRPLGKPESFRGFDFRIPGEILALDDARQPRISASDPLQGLVDREHLLDVFSDECLLVLEGLVQGPSSPFLPTLFSGVVDENLSHGPCRQAEKVTAVGVIQSAAAGDLEVGLVDEVGGFQALAALAIELAPGEAVEFIIEKRIDFARGILITQRRGVQQYGDFGGAS